MSNQSGVPQQLVFQQTPCQQPQVVRVCPHQYDQVEREYTERREAQIEAVCRELSEFEANHAAEKQHVLTECLELRTKSARLEAEVKTLHELNERQCQRIRELEGAPSGASGPHGSGMRGQWTATDALTMDGDAGRMQQRVDEMTATISLLRAEQSAAQTEQTRLLTMHSKVNGDLEKQLEYNQHLVKSYNVCKAQLEKKDKIIAKLEVERQAAGKEIVDLNNRTVALGAAIGDRDLALLTSQATIREKQSVVAKLQEERSMLHQFAWEHHGQSSEAEGMLQQAKCENAQLLRALFAYVHKYNDRQTWMDALSRPSASSDPVVMAPVGCDGCHCCSGGTAPPHHHHHTCCGQTGRTVAMPQPMSSPAQGENGCTDSDGSSRSSSPPAAVVVLANSNIPPIEIPHPTSSHSHHHRRTHRHHHHSLHHEQHNTSTVTASSGASSNTKEALRQLREQNAELMRQLVESQQALAGGATTAAASVRAF